MPYDIFISYRRNGGEYTAKILRDRLDELGYRVFFDVESLRSGDFNTKLYSVIDECTDFLLVLSPNALDRCVQEGDWVRREVEYALAKGKNIVPVMLRGFEFPETLPDPIEPLRYRNGLEANSQFFDAFLQQLREKFLLTRPTLRQRVSHSSLLRRTLPLLLALLILAGAGIGIWAAVSRWSAAYPRTAAEVNLTGEVVAYAAANLTSLDLMADALGDALDAAHRHLSTGSADFSSLEDRFALSWNALENIDLSSCAPQAGFLDRLSRSPFSLADAEAVYTSAEEFRAECMDYLAYIEGLSAPSQYPSVEDKLEILDHYQTILDYTLEMHACGYNMLFLPVTDTSALEELWYDYLPGLTRVPLSASDWGYDSDLLQSRADRCFNQMEQALLDLSVLIGDANMALGGMEEERDQLYEELVRTYMDLGYTRQEAEILIAAAQGYADQLPPELASFRAENLPRDGDGADDLWWKMSLLLSRGLFADALDCVDAYADATRREGDRAQARVDALRLFIDFMQTYQAGHGDLVYGVMVTDYYEPDGVNEVFQIGDIIYAFNGSLCTSYSTYTDHKSRCDGAYTVSVFRANVAGELESVDLELTTDMPRVHLSTVVYDGTDG